MSGYYIKIGATKLNPKRLARFSKRIRMERGSNCERCGSENSASAVHHFYEKHIFPMFAFEPDNVVVLCFRCHDMATSVERKWPDWSHDFYRAFPPAILKRLHEFRERAMQRLAEQYPESRTDKAMPLPPAIAPLSAAPGELNLIFSSESA
jgi:HNH endonuclease